MIIRQSLIRMGRYEFAVIIQREDYHNRDKCLELFD